MKVAGFTIVRNGVKFDYPFLESIRSILPVCDEVVVAVGQSDDSTREAVEGIGSPKIKILDTVWDDNLREGGRVLSVETNKALNAISGDTDWAFYVQADEVFHEQDLPAIKDAMREYLNDRRVEGLVFEHLNFYGSYDFIADAHNWVKREVRVIRKSDEIQSWRDAMSFRKNGEKLMCKLVEATIYHYGWVKHPKEQMAKRRAFEKLWHDDEWVEGRLANEQKWDYSGIDSLAPFMGKHPKVMEQRIASRNWNFQPDFDKMKKTTKEKLLQGIRKSTGWRVGEFKNYRLLS